MILNVVLHQHESNLVPAGVIEIPAAADPENCGQNAECFRTAVKVFKMAKENPSHVVRIDKDVYERTGKKMWDNIFTPQNVFLEENGIAAPSENLVLSLV
jgi:hypothetical protein